MRKAVFAYAKTKGVEQLRGNCTADQHLRFRYIGSSMPLQSNSEISILYTSSVAVQSGLCWTWSETLKTGFLSMRLIVGPDEVLYIN